MRGKQAAEDGGGVLGKARLGSRGERFDSGRGYVFMWPRRAEVRLRSTCRVLSSSTERQYDGVRRPRSARLLRDAKLKERIWAIWTGSGGTYGDLRIHVALRGAGWSWVRRGWAGSWDGAASRASLRGAGGRRQRGGRGRSSLPAPYLVNWDSLGGQPRLTVGHEHHIRVHVGRAG